MKRAFTLIELIVVIAIIAVLAAIVAPNAFKAIEKGKISATIGDYKAIKTAAMAFYSDLGAWPTNGGTLEVTNGAGLVNNTSWTTNTAWDGPYLEKWPARSQWGGNYTLREGATINWDGTAGNENARYVSVSGIPYSSSNNGTAGKLDQQLDGSMSNTTGSVQWGAPNTANVTANLLVSYD